MKKLLSVLGASLVFASCAALAEQPATPAAPKPQTAPVGPVASARVIMLRLYVADIDRGEKFYHEVFGTTVLQKMGENVHIMNFPGGPAGHHHDQEPRRSAHERQLVMQVPDVQATLAKAATNGGTLMNTQFAQNVEGMPARSSHFTDPDGNIIEVLQIGGPAPK